MKHKNKYVCLDDPKTRLKRKNSFDASLAIGTAAFNENTGRLKANENNFPWDIDPLSRLVKEEFLKKRLCPVCTETSGEEAINALPTLGASDSKMLRRCNTPSGQSRELFIKQGFRHVKCSDCGLIYVSHILKDEIIEAYWRQEQNWSEILTSGPQLEMDRLKFLYGLDLLYGRVKGSRLLDIGSGPGLFVRLAAEMGWDASALELNEASAQQLAKEGYEVFFKVSELKGLKAASFDLISFWEVLEHLAEPRQALNEAKRLLKPDGFLLIMVPNADSLVTRILHEKSNTFGGHSHLNHFNAKNLSQLCQSSGFEIVEIETVISELGTINNYLSFEEPYRGNAPNFFEGLSPELIHNNMWGSRLLAIAALL